ncbi:hypothetical protein E4U44_007638 [Claviceps purpurea]|nr:hypothetical protein E4U44_007638 [Claviceps purpurea]
MENHQDCCLRRVRIAIYSKDLTIAIEFTKHDSAWMDREGGAVNATTASTRDRRYIDCRRMARIEGLRD